LQAARPASLLLLLVVVVGFFSLCFFSVVLIEHPVYRLTVRLRLGRWFQPYTEPSLALRR
jgi:hypothetical protein